MNLKTLILKIVLLLVIVCINPIDIIVDDSDQINDHELNNLDLNNMNEEVNLWWEENVNEVEGNVVNFQDLENFSVDEALAFFSS